MITPIIQIEHLNNAINKIGPSFEPLSEREQAVLFWLAAGASNREIGQHLIVTESTVKRHVYHIFGKLNVRNRTQAALKAHQAGIIPSLNILTEQAA
jgi:DNA-binding NarL/FixJ family response regulator